MAWSDKIGKKFKIITGDGQEYFPLWKLESKEQNYNYTINNYPGVIGTFIDRRLRKGRKRTFDLYFKGENCHDIASNFLISAADRKAWIIEHPFDGILNVQPLSIKSIPTLNTVNLVIDTQETITQEGIIGSIDAREQIISLSDSQNSAAIQNLTDQPRNSSNIAQLQSNVSSLDQNFNDIITNQEEASAFQNFINDANRLSQQYVEDVTEVAKVLNDINRLIGDSTASVADRLRAIQNSTINLFKSVPNIPKIEFLIYAGFAANSNLVSAANIASTPQSDDYTTVSDVNKVKNQLIDYFNETIDIFNEYGPEQGIIGADIYELPEEPTRLAYETILASIGNLDQIAFSAKIEVEKLIDKDTNLLLLCYELYGDIDINEDHISELILINSLGPNSMLEIKAGSIIKYLI